MSVWPVGEVITARKADATAMVEAKIKEIMSGEVEAIVPEGVPGGKGEQMASDAQEGLQALVASMAAQASAIAVGKVDTSTQVTDCTATGHSCVPLTFYQTNPNSLVQPGLFVPFEWHKLVDLIPSLIPWLLPLGTGDDRSREWAAGQLA